MLCELSLNLTQLAPLHTRVYVLLILLHTHTHLFGPIEKREKQIENVQSTIFTLLSSFSLDVPMFSHFTHNSICFRINAREPIATARGPLTVNNYKWPRGAW